MIQLKCLQTKTTVIIGVTTVFFCFLFGFSQPVLAQTIGDSAALDTGLTQVEKSGLVNTDIRVVVARVIQVALGLLGIIFLIIIIYGGYLYMTAGGNQEQIASAKKVLTNSGVGLIIILSAYSIVLLVMRMLGIGGGTATDLGDILGGPSDISEQNFSGVGGLGGLIKDHYPARDQKDVARNAKIIITFKKAILLSSVVENTNGSKNASGQDLLGDCVNVGATMKWETDCDTLKKGADLINIKQTATGEEIRGAAVLSAVENGNYYTLVIRPFDALGNASSKLGYTVRIGKNVLTSDEGGASLFDGRAAGRDFYDWQFFTNTVLDTSAPVVTSVFPENASTESKNSVIQVSFSEAMDPTGLQGSFTAQGDHYAISGGTIFLKSDNSSLPVGDFRLVNNYKTLEFTPAKECGQNSCGGKIFCLPVCDEAGANCQKDAYKVLVKAATAFSASSFESAPFSGAADLAGNALDGNRNGRVDSVTSTGAVFPTQEKPDNFVWGFNLTNQVDATEPYLKKVTPGPDAQNVAPDQDLTLLFSKRMRVEPLYTIDIEEKPTPTEPVCVVPTAFFNSDGTTLVRLNHCPFVADQNHYYYPIVDSQVEDVKFNCFFPGKGPISTDQATKASLVCDENRPDRCCQVDNTPDNSFCCNGLTSITSKTACLNALKAGSPIEP